MEHELKISRMIDIIQAHALSYPGGKHIDKRVIWAMSQVPRHKFVKHFAYEDRPVPIGHEQTISQPFIVAYMSDVIGLQPLHKVLEIGTGSGYQAAILSHLAHEVYSVERIPELTANAKKLFEHLEYDNIKTKISDGYDGWSEHAPYDRIIVTAMANEVPVELTKQLVDGGTMIIPVNGSLLLITKKKELAGVPIIEEQTLIGVRFVPLVKGINA